MTSSCPLGQTVAPVFDTGQLGGDKGVDQEQRWPSQSAAQAKFNALSTEAAIGEMQDPSGRPLVVLGRWKRGVSRFGHVGVLVTNQ